MFYVDWTMCCGWIMDAIMNAQKICPYPKDSFYGNVNVEAETAAKNILVDDEDDEFSTFKVYDNGIAKFEIRVRLSGEHNANANAFFEYTDISSSDPKATCLIHMCFMTYNPQDEFSFCASPIYDQNLERFLREFMRQMQIRLGWMKLDIVDKSIIANDICKMYCFDKHVWIPGKIIRVKFKDELALPKDCTDMKYCYNAIIMRYKNNQLDLQMETSHDYTIEFSVFADDVVADKVHLIDIDY